MTRVSILYMYIAFFSSSCGGEEIKIVVVKQPTELAEEETAAPVAHGADGGADGEAEDVPSPAPSGCGPSQCPELKSFWCAEDGVTPLICGPRMGESEDCVSVWQDFGFVCPPGTVCTVSVDQRSFECVVAGVAPVCVRCGVDGDCPAEAPHCLVWTTNTAISWCSGPCGSVVNCPPDSTCFSGPAVSSMCVPRWWRECQDGDVWEVDSCGNVISMAEACGAAACSDGACL